MKLYGTTKTSLNLHAQTFRSLIRCTDIEITSFNPYTLCTNIQSKQWLQTSTNISITQSQSPPFTFGSIECFQYKMKCSLQI